MIRKTVYSLIPVAAALLLLASCNREEMPGMEVPAQTDPPREIRFEMAYATPAVAPDNGTPATRVATSDDGTYTNTWEDGDEVGVFIVKGNAGLQASGNWVDNMKMTFRNGGNWSYTLPAGKERYPMDEPLSFYAYYPYSATFDPVLQHLTLPADQSGQQNIVGLCCFTARTTGARNSSEPVRLVFSPTVAWIELSLTSGGDGGRLNDRIVATMEGCKTGYTLALETGKTKAEGEVSPVTLRRVEQPGDADYRTSYTYRALVPAQTPAANSELFRFTYKDVKMDKKLSYTPAEAVRLETGQVKPFEITLKPVIDPSHQYQVGDIYPHNGLPMGVVYEVSADGLHGKIVDYDFINTTWGKEVWIPENSSSGRANMKAVYEVNGGSFDGYPPFQWTDSLNPFGTEYAEDAKGIWYLPAQHEVKLMIGRYLKPEFFSSLQAISGLSYPEEGYFGSSTSQSVKSYAGWQYTLQDDQNPLGFTTGSKTEWPSNFFAVMEF